MHVIACWKLTRFTEGLSCTFVFRRNIKPCKERPHISSAETKKGKLDGVTSSQLDWFVCQLGERIQQHLRVFIDGAKGVSTVGCQRCKPSIGSNEVGSQSQKEAFLFFCALHGFTTLKIPADFTEPSGRIAIQLQESLLFHFLFSLR